MSLKPHTIICVVVDPDVEFISSNVGVQLGGNVTLNVFTILRGGNLPALVLPLLYPSHHSYCIFPHLGASLHELLVVCILVL